MQAPTLAAITLDATGGGIAVVSRLLWQVAEAHWAGRARLMTLFDHENRPATAPEKVRFASALALVEIGRRTDFILFSHLGLAQMQTVVPPRFRQPYGVFLHGIEAWRPLNRAETRALANAALRLANSSYTAHRVMDAHPYIGPVEVCRLALPDSTGGVSRSRVPSPAVPPQGSRVVLVVGRMIRSERYKGHDQLIEAWPRVAARVTDARLVIVGEGDDTARLKEKSANSPAAGTISFTGFVPRHELDALYAGASILALPSRGEGFGLVYLEAMAHGVACVGSIHDAAGEVIVDGETGRLVDQDDVPGLADTLATLLLDEPLRRRLGEAGRSRLQSEFSFGRFRERLLSLLGVNERTMAAAGA